MIGNLLILFVAVVLPGIGAMAIVRYVCERTKKPLGFFRRQKIEEAERRDVCNQCKYSLKGLPTANRCPECGKLDPNVWVTARHRLEWSRSRIALFLVMPLSIPVPMGWASSVQWKVQWALSKWGPRPHLAVLPDQYHLLWTGWLFLWLLILAPVTPWRSRPLSFVFLWLSGLTGTIIFNGLAVEFVSGRLYLMSDQGRVQDTPMVVSPYGPLIGLGAGLIIASVAIITVNGQKETRKVRQHIE